MLMKIPTPLTLLPPRDDLRRTAVLILFIQFGNDIQYRAI
jgi:hypothetical protein